MKNAIGLDVGHSAVKVAAGTEQVVIPSAAAPAPVLSTKAAKEAAKADTVTVSGQKWLVGEQALIHTLGRVADGLREDWVETQEYAALLKAGFERGQHALGAEAGAVVLGLPSRLFAAQVKRLQDIASATLQVDKSKILVVPQPQAAFFVEALGANGKGKNAAMLTEDWAIIDVGFYTTDFGFVQKGLWAEAASQSMEGSAFATEALKRLLSVNHGMEVEVRRCNEAMRSKSIRYNGKLVDLRKDVEQCAAQFASLIGERAERVFGSYLHESSGVLIVGGGAELVFEPLKKQWDHAKMPENPRFAVAEGMRRVGLDAVAE